MSAPIVVRGNARALPLPDCSVDAIVCDPPYELAFMGRSWDSTGVAFDTEPWEEALRVLKPGGHLAAFGASRTYHRVACAIEDAGFEMRDTVATWLYGSGFPKSLDVGKAIDKAGGGSPVDQGRILREARERSGLSRQDVVDAVGCTLTSLRDWEEGRARSVGEVPEVCTPSPGYRTRLANLLGYTADERQIIGVDDATRGLYGMGRKGVEYSRPRTKAARAWQGWGTALKPAWEPVILARKPLSGTVAATVLAHGTGAINVDASRVDGKPRTTHADGNRQGTAPQPMSWGESNGYASAGAEGRWPTNVVLAHHPDCGPDETPGPCVPGCQVAALDEQSGNLPTQKTRSTPDKHYGEDHIFAFGNTRHGPTYFGEQGGASRFFPTFRYQAKAPDWQRPRLADGAGFETVKPLDLMRWLVRLLTPPGGRVLDMYPGTGTTGQAAQLEGFASVLVEKEARHIEFIRERLAQRVRVDRRTDEAVPVAADPDDALSLFDLGDAS